MPKVPVSVAATAEVTPIHPEQESPAESESNCGNGPRTTLMHPDGSQIDTPPVSESDSCLVSFEGVTSISNDEIPEKFHPPSTYKFPKRKFGSTVITERSFQSHWCVACKWLHYDKATDAAFCHVCMRAQREKKFLSSHRREPAFITKGFTNWKEANKGFSKHQSSDCHKETIEAVCLLPAQLVGHVDELMSDETKQQKAMNRKIFIKILENTRYLAHQGLPFRGHDDSNGNFIQLMKLRGLDCPQIEQWMKKKTDTYLSHDIQDEILFLMSSHILRNVSKKIHGSGALTLMCDECTDISNKEQLTICFRWVDQNLNDHENFIGLYQVNNITAATLTGSIKDALLQLQIDLSMCRGQSYDGASNMSGAKNGVAAQITTTEKGAVYMHCYAHALNLAVSYTVKQSKVCCEALEVAYEISKLIKFSPKRNASFNAIKAQTSEEDDFKPGIRKFCPT